MVIMDNYYSQDHLREIWHKIDRLHLSYLQMEESQEKIDHRNRLEEFIAEFVCIVSHSQKFYFPETSEILQRSAASKTDFSGYKAATGWSAIQLYAGNLLSQPWRKEYRQIKTYCGFYVHQVKANLVGAERMFEAMGYKHAGDGILVLDGPICPDRVANVSKDCLVAYVECQILKAIWEETSNFNITWLDILDFRKSHICSPDQAVKALKHRQQRQLHQEHTRSYSQGSDPFTDAKYATPHNNHNPVFPMNQSFPPLSSHNPPLSAHNTSVSSHNPALAAHNASLMSHNHAALAPVQAVQHYMYANGCCGNNLPPYGPSYGYLQYAQPVMPKPILNSNGYYYMNGVVSTGPALPPYAYGGVPTGQLIEVESVEPYNGYDSVDSGPPGNSRVRRSIKPDEMRSTETYKPKQAEAHSAPKEADREDAQFEENWDYVYKKLESKGYRKDVGDRGNVLSPAENDAKRRYSRESKKQKPTDLDAAMNNLGITDTNRPLKISEAIEKFEHKATENRVEERRNSIGSSYDNLTKAVKQQPSTSAASNNLKIKTLPREKPQSDTPQTPHIQSKTLDIRKPKEGQEGVKCNTSWQCQFCTYVNENAKVVCDMCSKSREITEESPMEVGGAECSKCTLVNPKSLKKCQACEASLENSPTYI